MKNQFYKNLKVPWFQIQFNERIFDLSSGIGPSQLYSLKDNGKLFLSVHKPLRATRQFCPLSFSINVFTEQKKKY